MSSFSPSRASEGAPYIPIAKARGFTALLINKTNTPKSLQEHLSLRICRIQPILIGVKHSTTSSQFLFPCCSMYRLIISIGTPSVVNKQIISADYITVLICQKVNGDGDSSHRLQMPGNFRSVSIKYSMFSIKHIRPFKISKSICFNLLTIYCTHIFQLTIKFIS